MKLPKAAVLLAGDSKHPNERVEKQIEARTELFCLGNGIRRPRVGKDLGIEIEGARPPGGIVPCQPVVSIELDSTGKTTVLAGHSCDNCQFGKNQLILDTEKLRCNIWDSNL